MPPEKKGKEKTYNPLLLIVIYGSIAVYGFVHNIKGVSYPLIKNTFNASYSQQGLMTAMLSFAGVCFCIIPGIFLGRFGLKKTVLCGFFIMILGMLSLYLAGSFWAAAGLLIILQAGMGFMEIGLNGMGVRIFTVKPALMMILLHFFFGIGAIFGPRFAGFVLNNLSLEWQLIYPLAIIPVLVFLVISMTAAFPGKMKAEENSEAPPDQISLFSALKVPLVWNFGLTMGIIGAVEACSVSWSGLYLQDVFGIDPGTGTFVSTFFILYTISRLISGFVAEKIGYIKFSLGASIAVPVILLIGFLLGRPGIVILPVTGFFIAPIYPTILAMSVSAFGKKAQAMSPAIISIAFTLGGFMQLGFGLSNSFLGPAWAYRSCVIYGLAVFILILKLRAGLKKAAQAIEK